MSDVHGYPDCDCDLIGGDSACTIQPPYQTQRTYVAKLIEINRDLVFALKSCRSALISLDVHKKYQPVIEEADLAIAKAEPA